jgi:acetyl-CoA acyltransferase
VRDAVIVKALRTPVGKRNGGLADLHPVDLAAHILQSIIARTGLDPILVDDVVWGCVNQIGEQSHDIARNALLAAGWPESVPGTTVDRQCGSSQQAVHFAAAGLIAGHYDVVVAGGVESMSRVPIGSAVNGKDAEGPRFAARYHPTPHQGRGAELIAEKWGLSRTQLDEFALGSHEKAASAQDAGFTGPQIVPVPVGGSVVSDDEGIRRGGTLEGLAKLKPAFAEDGRITAATSSQISDGAAALLMTTSEMAASLGLEPIARVHSVAVVGDDPQLMLTAPIPATAKVLQRSGLSLADIGVFEINEAFASVPLAWLAETGADPELLNPQGGAIALGHPLGGSGARIMTDMIHFMRRTGVRYGLQSMCENGGQANATIIEAL